MAAHNITLHKPLDKSVTLQITVRVSAIARARMWLARILLTAAAKSLGCGAEVDIKTDSDAR